MSKRRGWNFTACRRSWARHRTPRPWTISCRGRSP